MFGSWLALLDLTSGEHTHSIAVEKITKAEACETLSIYLTGAEQDGSCY